jgi:thiamine-monophosphate kinase
MQLGIGDLHDLGRLLIATNLADLCGSGASPLALLTAITMEHGTRLKDFERLMSGINTAARRWGVPVVGGDTKLGGARAILAVALGWARSSRDLFLRNGARPNDHIWVSGALGSCCAALVGLSEGMGDDDWRLWARRAILDPRLPMEQSRKLSAGHWANGGTDISDGLGADLLNLCRSSSVGARIAAERIPLEPEVYEVATALGIPAYRLAFPIGGDLQFLVTAPPENSSYLSALGFTNIGRIEVGSTISMQLPSGEIAPLPTEGHRDIRQMPFLEEVRSLIARDERPTMPDPTMEP